MRRLAVPGRLPAFPAGRWRLILAAVLLPSAPLAGALTPQIRGTACEGDLTHPAPGVFIALYDAGDLLVDSTYSRNDGGFRLLTPSSRGHFYVIATRAGSSQRKDFDFDPAAGRTRSLVVTFPRKSWLRTAGEWGGDKLGGVAGLLIGYLFRSLVEERGSARAKRKRFLEGLRAAFDEALAKYPPRDQEVLGSRVEIAAAVRSIAGFLERHDDIQDALAKLAVPLRKDRERQGLRTLKNAIATIENDLDQAENLADNPRRDLLLAVKTRLRQLRERPLG
jgi:uncharacterized membrane-anchored protein YhcB (DUF1043 family)